MVSSKQSSLAMSTLTLHSNLSNLKMIEEMGITPDRSVRVHKPSLRVVGKLVLFCVRARKASEVWGENKKLHESLVKKVETMRGRRKPAAHN
jgi:hypothetical protein